MDEQNQRVNMISTFYDSYDEDARLIKSRHGQLEYITTLKYIHSFAKDNCKILEIGAGTGRYSITLAKEGYEVTAIELVQSNLDVLNANGKALSNLKAYQGDALKLQQIPDEEYDVTLILGPLYHLYNQEDVHKALDEAIRVTKKGGVIFAAFLSVYGIMLADYFRGNFCDGLAENFTEDYQVKHFMNQLFTGYDICEFEQLFSEKETNYITTVSIDSVLETIEQGSEFKLSDEEFQHLVKLHLAICEKRELLGNSNHLLYICRKK